MANDKVALGGGGGERREPPLPFFNSPLFSAPFVVVPFSARPSRGPIFRSARMGKGTPAKQASEMEIANTT